MILLCSSKSQMYIKEKFEYKRHHIMSTVQSKGLFRPTGSLMSSDVPNLTSLRPAVRYPFAHFLATNPTRDQLFVYIMEVFSDRPLHILLPDDCPKCGNHRVHMAHEICTPFAFPLPDCGKCHFLYCGRCTPNQCPHDPKYFKK